MGYFGKIRLGAALALTFTPTQVWALNEAETKEVIKTVDDRQRNTGDYASLVAIVQKEKDGSEKAFEAHVYRRDADDKWMILFTQPKTEAGKGYLRLEKNLFLYDPAVGKWQRQTERASIAGTNSRRDDFDESRLSIEYDAVFVGDEKLGIFPVHHFRLTAKPKVEVASPVVELWVDAKNNILKRQEFSLPSSPKKESKLLRTTYYPKWIMQESRSKKATVWVPQEIRVFDEIEKGNSTTIKLTNVKLDPLDPNMFTKAWLESKSR